MKNKGIYHRGHRGRGEKLTQSSVFSVVHLFQQFRSST